MIFAVFFTHFYAFRELDSKKSGEKIIIHSSLQDNSSFFPVKPQE
jgi:hypothetical protein